MSIEVQPGRPTAERRVTTPATAAPTPQRRPRTGSWWKRLLLALGVVVVLAAGAYPLIRMLTPESGTNVLTHAISRGDLVVSVAEEGTLESSSNKEIKCKVKGTSQVLWVIESGTQVQPGDELVRLDTSQIEDNISQQKIAYENALANKTTTSSDVAVAKIAITEYLEGTFRSEMATKRKDLVVAQSNLKSAQDSLFHARRMFRKSYIGKLELDAQEDAVKHGELEVQAKQIDLDVLEKFTKEKTLQELRSALEAAEARLASDTAALELEQARLTREEQQLENCVILADVAGMVIYPSAAEWKEQPDIEEGAMVREDQVLLMIPDLSQMQVKIGIHESKVDRLQRGMPARVEVQDGFIPAEVDSIASVAKPAGWWSGNMVNYDTVISLDENQSGLKPGMSASVVIYLARHEDVLTIPVAAVVEQRNQFLCWVETDRGIIQRKLKLGDSNDQFIIVEDGLKEGERVVLNPIDFIDEAQRDALKPIEEAVQMDDQRAAPGDASRKSSDASRKSSDASRKGADDGREKPASANPARRAKNNQVPTKEAQIKKAPLKINDGKRDATGFDPLIKRKPKAGGR